VIVTHVQDLSDPLLADYHALTDVALRTKSEPAQGLYIAESLKILERALRAGHQPRSVLTIPGWLPKLEELSHAMPGALDDVEVFVSDAELMETLTGYHVHRGTLASMNRPPMPDIQDLLAGATRIVVLEDIVDHTNVGAIFRSVAGIGADAVIVTDSCADPLYRRSVRVSMGTVFQVPWTRAGSWTELVAVLRANDVSVVALALTPEAIALDFFAAKPPTKLALVLGTEGDGLSLRAVGDSDAVVSIPMRGGVDSLNVAAASAVALWALRDR
jgi:tRNA G18 (ribose-2'-O)-methylase SpoU